MTMTLRYQVTCSTDDGSAQIGSSDILLDAIEMCIDAENRYNDPEDFVICFDSQENIAIDWEKIAHETDWESLNK